MLLVFLHGWSVTTTGAYGGLPTALARNAPAALDLRIQHVYLAKYISFADEVRVDDIARGMQNAVSADILPRLMEGERFACVTHSTGGPVVRTWIDRFFRGGLAQCPLQHLVMLAPANHGSALAQLGKSCLARMKFFADGIEPGVGVLDWLALGSPESWDLNTAWLNYDCLGGGIFPFVLTGQTIDRSLYDSLNSYTGEAGSDGVVRVAAANLNYALVRMCQDGKNLLITEQSRASATPFGVLPGVAHSGAPLGVMASVAADDDGSHPTVRWVLRCLLIRSKAGYRAMVGELERLTARTQKKERRVRKKGLFLLQRTFVTDRYCMFVFRLLDDRSNPVEDFDLEFTAGPSYDANHLAPGFFKDRQRNLADPSRLTYYIDYDVMQAWLAKPELEGKFGFKITARPDVGFAHYTLGEYRGARADFSSFFAPNQTTMIEMQLERRIAEGVLRLTQDLGPDDFRGQSPGPDIE